MAVSIVQSQMAPAVLQPFNNAFVNGTFASRCQAGNTIVAFIGGGTINSGQTWTVSAVTDDDLNTYTIIPGAFRRLGGSPPNDSGVFDEGVMIAVATNIAATPVGHTNAVVIAFGANTEYGSGGIYELSPCTLDQALTATANGSSAVSVGPLTPAANGAFIVGITQHDFNGSTGGFGVTAGRLDAGHEHRHGRFCRGVFTHHSGHGSGPLLQGDTSRSRGVGGGDGHLYPARHGRPLLL